MTNTSEDLAAEIMCECTGTTRGKIFDLVTEGLDFNAISRKTGVNTGCGGCEWEIETFIEALQEK
ncbi:MAG: (2Fe-2S)-binding protein [Methylophilaceae bacterium]|nr:MAG: (2Fe-2S)-binding protein [Methylophilaceae bacterium]